MDVFIILNAQHQLFKFFFVIFCTTTWKFECMERRQQHSTTNIVSMIEIQMDIHPSGLFQCSTRSIINNINFNGLMLAHLMSQQSDKRFGKIAVTLHSPCEIKFEWIIACVVMVIPCFMQTIAIWIYLNINRCAVSFGQFSCYGCACAWSVFYKICL